MQCTWNTLKVKGLIAVNFNDRKWAVCREEPVKHGIIAIVPPPYILIDFRLPLNAAQVEAVRRLLDVRFERIVIDFAGESRTFTDREEARRYVLDVN